MRFCLLVAALLTSLAGILPAQQATCSARSMFVRVTDKRGALVQDLTSASFQARAAGQTVKVLSAGPDSGPRRVVMVLDMSGSMESMWDLARTLAGDLVANAPQRFSFGLLLFSEGVTKKVSFDEGRNAVAAALHDAGLVKPHGKTALVDALAESIRMIGQPRFGDVIYVISDGGENISREDWDHLEKDLLPSGIRLFYALIPDSDLASPMNGYSLSFLEELRGRTGGAGIVTKALIPSAVHDSGAYYLKGIERDRLAAAARELYGEMAFGYRVDVEVPASLAAPHKWDLQVVGAQNEKMKDVKVSRPSDLFPCANRHPQTGLPGP